ncbi:MAG: ATP-binding cassette domain-containing protein, partial [Chloroflexota bacterium]
MTSAISDPSLPVVTEAILAPVPAPTEASAPALETATPAVISLRDVSFYYGPFRAVKGITFDVAEHQITSIIGPSGCGKSTLLRSINRMNDLIPGTRVEGQILYHDEDLYASYVDPVEVRRRIGMVFQKPNPFPKSIYD